MCLRLVRVFTATSLLVAIFAISILVGNAAEDASHLGPGAKVIVDIGGKAVGEVVNEVAPQVYRIRVKIHTGDVIEPALPIQLIQIAPADAVLGTATHKVDAKPASTVSGTVTSSESGRTAASSGTVTSGTVTPGTVTSGTVTPGTVTSGTVTQGTVVEGKTIVTPGTVTPGRVTAGQVTPGTVTQHTTAPRTFSFGTATPGKVTSGTATSGTVTAGTATGGTSTSSNVTVAPGSAGASNSVQVVLQENPAGKTELGSLVGVWKIVSVQRNGRPVNERAAIISIKPTEVAIGGDVFDRVSVDPISTPRRIDLVKADSDRLLRGIYEHQGNRLRVCLNQDQAAPRPSNFSTAENGSYVLYECELSK